MSKNNGQTDSSTDVAMFIDWENMHGAIRGKANVSALREVAEGYGRFVLAKAYADWRESRFQRDSLLLYKIGFEPVYVPAGSKNNVDVKLATDCIDFAYKHPKIGVFILVTGDGDFVHVATTLRPLGKRVVVIAQSDNASSRLGDLVDTLLIYEKDVNPVMAVSPSHTSRNGKSRAPSQPDEVYRDIVEILRHEGGGPVLLTNIKQKLISLYGSFDQRDYGFEQFKAFVKPGAQKSFFVLNTAGLRDWLTLPQQDSQAASTELPEEIDQVFQEIVAIIRTSQQPHVFLSYIKLELIKKFGGFNESVYGYSQFKQLMEEGARLGYLNLGINDKKCNYAYLPQNGNQRVAHPQ